MHLNNLTSQSILKFQRLFLTLPPKFHHGYFSNFFNTSIKSPPTHNHMKQSPPLHGNTIQHPPPLSKEKKKEQRERERERRLPKTGQENY